jgi:uncharacterized protein YjbJ (UPF0337 family)
MNWDRIAGNWKQVQGKAREQWGKLTDDDLMAIAGQREQLLARIREHYNVAEEEAERQVADWEKKVGFGPSGPE